jgi:Leucine-rich repeat (LRR) protein
MFVIPCKYTDKSNIIELVNSINELHPNDTVLILDSDSDDKSYIELLKRNDKNVFSYNNKKYIDSAVWYAYENFKDEKFFYVLHDSMMLKSNLDKYKNYSFTSYMHFKSDYSSLEMHAYVINACRKLNINYIEPYTCLFGITFFCQRHILDKLYNLKLNTILPRNKFEMQCSERLWGQILSQLNVDLIGNSLCGDFQNQRKSDELIKFFPRRK